MRPRDDVPPEMNPDDTPPTPEGLPFWPDVDASSDLDEPVHIDGLGGLIDGLRALGDVPAPEPSPQLSGLFVQQPRRSHRQRRVAGIVVLATAVAVVPTTVAAAHDSLPGPTQQFVSNVINEVTPFHVGPFSPARLSPTPPSPTSTNPTTQTTSGAGGDAEGSSNHDSDSGSDVQPSASPSERHDDAGGPVSGQHDSEESGTTSSGPSPQQSEDSPRPSATGTTSQEPDDGER